MICTRCTHTCMKSTVSLKDGHGQQVYSAPATVQDGGDSRYGGVGSLSGFLLTTCSNLVASTMTSRRARNRALPAQRRRKHPFCVCWLHSDTPNSSTSVSPGVAAVNPETSSGSMAATTNSATSSSYVSASHKSEAAKSSSSASPSQSVKANSVARDISSGVIAGIMIAVGLTSILVTLVV